MKQLKTARAYVRALRGWSEDDQASIVRAYAKAAGWECSVIRESVEGRAAWMRQLRAGAGWHVALLPSLHILSEPAKTGKGRPLVDFTATLAQIQALAPLVVDATANATSADPVTFSNAVASASNRVAKGRPLPVKRARLMVEKRWAPGVVRGIVDEWSRDWNAKEFRRYRDVWRSHTYTTDGAALDAVNSSLSERDKTTLVIGSTASARRIFGGRRGKR